MDELNINELKKLFLFQLFSDTDLAQALTYFTRREYFAGSAVFNEHDRGESMYVILQGSVKIVKVSGETIAELHEGDFFGEVALFDYALRTASAAAFEDSVILEITRNEFNKLFSTSPGLTAKFLYQMMTEMSRRLRRKNNPGGGIIF
jgi:CRP-like cAMP-binding protein